MSAGDLTIRLGIDASDSTKQIQEINRELKSLDKQIKSVSDTTDGYNKTSDSLKKQLELQTQKQDALNAKLKAQEKILKDRDQSLKREQQKLQNLQKSTRATADEIDKQTKSVEKAQVAYNKANREYAETQTELQKVNRTIEDTKNKISSLDNEVTDTTKDVSKFNEEIKKVSTIDALGTWCTNTGQKLQDLGLRMYNVGEKVTALGMTIQHNIGDRVWRGLEYAYDVFTDFETALTNTSAIAGYNAEQLNTIKESCKALGAEMPLTASEVAEAYGYMALAGWDYEQQLNGIEGITKSSIAWNTDLATTSDLVTDALSATGKTVDDLTWFLDIATKTQNKANTTATDLMKAWIECGGTANQLGIDIDESAVALGVLA